ncbi:MAG: type II toxin-antitoxin system VapC family toxin [Bacteroidales bacterium]|nr:type II toxin-antitoxin system VapC family toxin [Bacteroidales bacterium]
MSGNSLFLDTNIVLYLFSGDKTIAELLDGKNIFISFITELEILSYPELNPEQTKNAKAFINDVSLVDINSEIKRIVVELRKSYKIKLPDAIIAASAYYLNVPLFTADKGFSRLSELNILLYEA